MPQKKTILHRFLSSVVALMALTATQLVGAITIDPGMVGSAANNPLTTTTINPGTLSVDYEFAGMKHIEVTQYGFIIDYPFLTSPTAPPETVHQIEVWLTEMGGIEIPNTRELETVTFAAGLIGEPPFPITVVTSIAQPTIAHDIHFAFSGTAIAWLPAYDLEPIANGQVGEWSVPEPAPLALMAMGLAGLAFPRRKTA